MTERSRRIGKATKCPVHGQRRYYEISAGAWLCPETHKEACSKEHMTAEEQAEHPWLQHMEKTLRRARIEEPGAPR